jgi:hypothetical protein
MPGIDQVVEKKIIDYPVSETLSILDTLVQMNVSLLPSTVKPVLTTTSEQWPPVYNGQLELQFSKML